MASHKEVEIKFAIEDLAVLSRHLLDSGFRLVTPRTHEMNVLYDLPGNKLRRRGELLRLRKYGNAWKLTHKKGRKGGRHKVRVESESTVEDGEKMGTILEALGYRPIFRYEKFRSEWSDGRGHVVIDETPVGNYAEIEGAPGWIDRAARLLGVDREQYITGSYAELFSQWKRRTGSRAQDMTFQAVASTLRRPTRW